MLHPNAMLLIFGILPGFFTVLIGLGVVLYFLPTLIAANRRNHNTAVIFVLNLLLGWTFIGWIVSLILALASSSRDRSSTIIVNNDRHSGRSLPGDKVLQLRALKELLDEGVLTHEEFNRQKASILD